MTTNSLWTILKQTFLEGDKGSGKAVCSYLAMATMVFILVYDTIKAIEVPVWIILQLMAFICTLYGIKMNQAIQKMKLENADDVPTEQLKPQA